MTDPKPHRISIPKYSLSEELLNSISHGVGAIFGIVATVLCILKSCAAGDPWRIVSGAIFGATMLLLYLMSCLYHALKVNKAKRVFRVIDHCTIFLLIVGTYTPFTLVTLRDSVGWWLFGAVWGIAILGITLNAIDLKRFSKISVACYLLMGWAILSAIEPLRANLAPGGIALLVWGGVVYSVGAILYGIGSKVKYFHSIFHFFCLGGSVLHFLAIYQYAL